MAWSPATHVVSVFMLLLIISTLSYSQAQITITALTPQEGHGMPDGTTAVLQLATALLGGSTPAMLWGTIPADAVQQICDQVVQDGNYDFSATVNIDGYTLSRNMQITALGGCDAAADGTDGVEAVLSDDDGTLSALICPSENSDSSGCDLYDSGDDISSLYNEAMDGGGDQNSNSTSVNGGGRGRKLLSNCFTEGTVKGATWGLIGGIVAGIFICDAGLNVGCDVAVALAATGAGAGGGVLYQCTGSQRGARSGCFPGSTLVTTSIGASIPISKLSLGDKVAVRSHDGPIAFSSVYAFGHADSSAIFPFIQITLQQITSQKLGVEAGHLSSIRVVKLTGDHFIPTISTKGFKIIYKRAREILVGDTIFATSGHGIINATSTITQFVVKDIVQVLEEGLYNPFTLKGDIIVDGVVASIHSEWFLDNIFDTLGLSHLLPHAYQEILLPIRTLYRILGEDMYNRLYTTLEHKIGVSTIGNIYVGAQITLLTILMAAFIFHTITKKCTTSLK